MEGSKKQQKVVLAPMAGLLCVSLLLLGFMATDVNAQQQQCSISQLSSCMAAVTRGTPPSAACCAQVSAVSDFDCFCNIMLSQSASLPPAYVNNAVLVPSKCGAAGNNLRNRQCGNVHIP